MIKSGYYLLAFLLTLSLSACATINTASVTEISDSQFSTELLKPIYLGQQELINNLGATPHEVAVFSINNQQVKVGTSNKNNGSSIWNPNKIVFFRINEKGRKTPGIYYFDNRNSHFYRVNDTKQSGEFLLFRFQSVKKSKYAKNHTQKLVGLKFKYNQTGRVAYSGTLPVSGIPGTPYLPVYLRDKGIIFFLSRDSSKTLKLYSLDDKGGKLKRHIANGAGNLARIFTDDGKNLIIESDVKGYQSLFKYDYITGVMTDYDRSESINNFNDKYALSNRFARGVNSPAVIKLPKKLNLNNIRSLVIAQNPEVNLKKAEYAAMLVKAGIAELPSNPYINFEIGTSTVAGLLNNNRGVLSRTIANGLVGLVKPILDVKRNKELIQVAKLDAIISKGIIDNEINEKVAQALHLYFELLYYKELDSIWSALLVEYQKRVAYYQKLKREGNSITREILAAKNVLIAAQSEYTHNLRQIGFLERSLKQLTGLPQNTKVALENNSLNYSVTKMGNDKVLHDLALLNHPRLKIVLDQIKRAHHIESVGPDIRRKLNFTADYVFTGNDSRNSIIDNINLGLDGSISTVQKRADRLNSKYWKQIKDSLRIKLGVRSNQVHLQLEEALKDFRAAENDFLAKKANVIYFLERIRVARLYASVDYLNEEEFGSPLAVSTAIIEHLKAVSKLAKVKKDIGVRYINVWRETGRSKLLPEQLKISNDKRAITQKDRSVWLWKTKDAIKTEASRKKFIELAKFNGVNRVYAYLYSDSRLLDNELHKEQMSLFLSACKREGINVWGLLGEPEWLSSKTALKDISRGIDRVLNYNKALNSYEPKIAGIKLDIEPHGVKGWDTDINLRNVLNNRYLALLQASKSVLKNRLPLWVDAPVKLFTHEKHNKLKNDVVALTDGITAMAYFDNPKIISAVAIKVLNKSSKPIEIGVEFSSNAPPKDSLYPVKRTDISSVLSSISNPLKSRSNFQGISLHDYTALKTMTGDF